jgi:hypothetical protein
MTVIVVRRADVRSGSEPDAHPHNMLPGSTLLAQRPWNNEPRLAPLGQPTTNIELGVQAEGGPKRLPLVQCSWFGVRCALSLNDDFGRRYEGYGPGVQALG